MPMSTWPTQNEFNDIFVDFYPILQLFGHFFLFISILLVYFISHFSDLIWLRDAMCASIFVVFIFVCLLVFQEKRTGMELGRR